MAGLINRNGSFRLTFLWNGKRESFTLGKISAAEAEAKSAQVDYLLLRLKQKLAVLPPGMSIVEYMQSDGKAPPAEASGVKKTTLGELRDKYIETHEASLEASTVSGIRIHFDHLTSILGEKLIVGELSLGELQTYVNKRSKAKGQKGRKLSPATIVKELTSLRTAFHWAVRMGMASGTFPNKGLSFAKSVEKPPFLTRDQILHRIKAGKLKKSEASDLWDAMYLTVDELADMLKQVKEQPSQPFVYPMTAFAAHTGARRAELLRVKTTDVDFAANVATITEKKRVRGRVSRRQVPLSPFLIGVLKDWLKVHPGGPYLFCQQATVGRSRKRSPTTGHQAKKRPTTRAGREAGVSDRATVAAGALTKDEAYNHFRRAVDATTWSAIRGLHTLRHSFVSACASRGVDQRLVEAWAGHMSLEMSRRYAHLWPSVQQEALAKVFG